MNCKALSSVAVSLAALVALGGEMLENEALRIRFSDPLRGIRGRQPLCKPLRVFDHAPLHPHDPPDRMADGRQRVRFRIGENVLYFSE